jgi:hypothetical protein
MENLIAVSTIFFYFQCWGMNPWSCTAKPLKCILNPSTIFLIDKKESYPEEEEEESQKSSDLEVGFWYQFSFQHIRKNSNNFAYLD